MIIKKYFAAANGYSGFRSYFDKVFNPFDFDRIYVIKGGPGTGKSSLMKKIADNFQEYDIECDKIYCSSDPNSLDGIILRNKSRQIAILDGTAPHETDAKIPGAIDKIINVGEFWEEEKLKEKSEIIKELNLKKSAHYKLAYKYLKLAGYFNDSISEIIEKAYKNDDFDILNSFREANINKTANDSKNRVRLINSYGKYGLKALEKENFISENNYTVKGVYGSEYIFLSRLKKLLDIENFDYILYPSPLSDKMTDGIYIIQNNTFISTVFDFENKIDTADFLDKKLIDDNKEFIEACKKEKDNLLLLSKSEFNNASTLHFKLEEIYSKNMNFEKLNELIKSLIKEIYSLLF